MAEGIAVDYDAKGLAKIEILAVQLTGMLLEQVGLEDVALEQR